MQCYFTIGYFQISLPTDIQSEQSSQAEFHSEFNVT